MKKIIIAIDGPAGSGKSTIAKIIANKFNLTYLDTGAMYRMITLYMLQNNIDIKNKNEVIKNLNLIKIEFKDNNFLLNSQNVNKLIRTKEVNENVSIISAIKEVREKLVSLQREIAINKNSILDGRDIGTKVFPDADLKFFLVADAKERAKRRYKEEIEKGIDANFAEVLKIIEDRDYIDSHRTESPLKKANDAIEIDTTNMTIDEVVNEISKNIGEIYGK